MSRGIITTIQRMSIHDGPGIRSTVFLKGCNLRCRWCHNPETWSSHKQLLYVADTCVGCGACVAVCPEDALSLHPGHLSPDRLDPDRLDPDRLDPDRLDPDRLNPARLKINRLRCVLDGACERACEGACVNGALSVVGRETTALEVVDALMEDAVFFEESGGGVTLSGGEPLMQPEFALDILRECRRRGMHTAVETNLTAPWEVIQGLLPWVDLWMCDLKLADRDRHKTWTGAYNDRVIGNLHNLAGEGTPVILRTPVIPQVNDNEREIAAICRLAAPLSNLLYYELLEFHALGFDKFRHLGQENPLASVPLLERERFRALGRIPAAFGLKTKPD